MRLATVEHEGRLRAAVVVDDAAHPVPGDPTVLDLV